MLPCGGVEVDQDAYIKGLKPITHTDLVGKAAEAPLPDHIHASFWSLLGAVAYALLTQHWVAVYVVALQRKTHSAQVIHVRRLNAIVRALQARPARITYRGMDCTSTLECHSDSGFSKEQDSGYGIRGANFARAGTARTNKQPIWHLIDSQCKGHKHVTRSSFASEVRAAVAAADEILPLALTLHELKAGPKPPSETRRLCDEGRLSIKTVLVTDSMSLWAAVAASTMRIPSEKNLAVHMFWLRELLDRRQLHVLRWCDTRDMSADAHTKGSIPRDAILDLMEGYFKYQHPTKDFSSPKPRGSE